MPDERECEHAVASAPLVVRAELHLALSANGPCGPSLALNHHALLQTCGLKFGFQHGNFSAWAPCFAVPAACDAGRPPVRPSAMSKQRSTIGLRSFSTNAALPSAPFCIDPDTSNKIGRASCRERV